MDAVRKSGLPVKDGELDAEGLRKLLTVEASEKAVKDRAAHDALKNNAFRRLVLELNEKTLELAEAEDTYRQAR